MFILIAFVSALFLGASGAVAGGGNEAKGETERDVVVRFLVADARMTPGLRMRGPVPRARPALRAAPGARREADHLIPSHGFATPLRRGRLFSGRAARAQGIAARWQPAANRPRTVDPFGDALRTLAEVAPSDRDKRYLKRMIRVAPNAVEKIARTAPSSRVEKAARTSDPATPHGVREPAELEHATQRRRGIHRFIQRFADELVAANESHLSRIRLEGRLLRINGMRSSPTDRATVESAAIFFQEYLQRRGPRAVYSAAFKTAGSTPFVARTSRAVMRFRDRYLNVTHTYGDYDRESLADQTDASVADWAERNESRLTLPEETIEEELERRRLDFDETNYNPFRRGRVTLRASTTDWVELVWTTPNLELKVAPKKSRVRMGMHAVGLDFASYASTRYRDWRGRSGVEIVRNLDEWNRIRLSAGLNYGQENEDGRTSLVDFFSLTDDARFVYLAWERLF